MKLYKSKIETTRLMNKSHMVLYQLTKYQKEIIKACEVKLSKINSWLNFSIK